MKNKISALMTILGLTLILTGCGEPVHSDKLVLALRSGTYADVIRSCLPDFEAEYGMTCEVQELSEDDLHSYILDDSVRSKGEYDLCMVDGSWVSEYIYDEVLADLGELGYSLDDDIIPATTSICIQNGRTYLVPYYGNVTVMMFNRSTAEELGIDAAGIDTLESVMDLCKKSSESGKGGFVYRGDTENNIVVDFLPILCAFGGWVVDEDNHPTVNTTEFQQAMEYYMELTATGSALPKEELISSIEDGSMVMAIGWPGWYNADSVSSDYLAFPGMATSDSASYNSNIYGIWTLGIPNNSTNKEGACELLKYLMDSGVQKSTVAAGGVPCRYSSLTDPEILADNPHMSVLCTALENGKYRPVMQEWSRFYTILGKEMKHIMNGEMSLEDGLNIAQEELEDMLKKASR